MIHNCFNSSTENPPVKIRRSLRIDSSADFRLDVNATLPDFHKEIKQLKKTYLSANDELEADPSFEELKCYVDNLMPKLENIVTEKLSQEILDVVMNPDLIGTENRTMVLTKEQGNRLNSLHAETNKMTIPAAWTWGAKDTTNRGKYNTERLKLCIDKEMQYKIVHCKNCGSSGITLVGIEQLGLPEDRCYLCSTESVSHRSNHKSRDERLTTWKNKVRPTTNTYPKCVEPEFRELDLPELSAGEKSVICMVQPVVTVKRTFFKGKKYRQESISLLKQEPESLWVDVLPRADLKSRFVVIEQTRKSGVKSYIYANPWRVERWLNYLFDNHPEYVLRKNNGQLKISKTALVSLQNQSELANVESSVEYENESDNDEPEHVEGTEQTALQSGFTESNVYCFDEGNLYLLNSEFMKLKKDGKIEIHRRKTKRKPIYDASANLSHPHLYPNGEMSPLDFHDWKLAEELLRRQTMFAHKTADGKYRWRYAEDDIHMMHQFARLQETRVHARVGFYLSQHPQAAHLPMDSVLNAFKNGFDDQGLLDSHLPDLSALLTKIPNSREKWFAERLDLESISRDLGEPNLFLTVNMDARSWPDVRKLIHELEYGPAVPFDRNWPYANSQEYTRLMAKFAPQVSIYLCNKVKIFLRAYLSDICGVDMVSEKTADYTKIDKFTTSWFWRRVEFTETRGVQHWHCLVKLPNVLDTSVLGRVIHNGRVVRQELKFGNIKREKEEVTWKLIKMGLLASRYVSMFADSISTTSFYTETMDPEQHDPSKVINVEKLREDFVKNCKTGNLTCATHPTMRKYGDPECDADCLEMAKVAAASCMHHCIPDACGGDRKTGEGCRFSFPKKPMRITVPAVMQVNEEQMEAQILLKRTCSRVPNLNRHFLLFFRANHDMTVLIDAAHKMRYATKYASKSGKHNELLNEVVEQMHQRSMDLMPPSMKQILSHLILADCSHRSFMTKQELSYKVMGLPEIRRSFPAVEVVGFYNRANIKETIEDEEDIIEFSDRTAYSAYAERCNDETKLSKSTEELKLLMENMSFREFAETVNFTWKQNDKQQAQPIDPATKRKFKTRNVNSGHWILSFKRKRQHIRWSTVLYSNPAIEYEPIDITRTDSQSTFFALPREKRQQLYRAYQELICYVPWKNSPDEFFRPYMSDEDLTLLEMDPEDGSRYSLRRLQAFFNVYRVRFTKAFTAQSNTDDPSGGAKLRA